MSISFDNLNIPTEIHFKAGALNDLGAFTRQHQGSHVLLVSDIGIAEAGIVERAEKILHDDDIAFSTWLGVEENPKTTTVDNGVAFAKGLDVDLIIGLGGGSSMDCAKGINFIRTNGGSMQDYWGIGKANAPMLPMLAVPTTAGTGSESQSFALISDPETGTKMACGDKKAAFKAALLDPELTFSQPMSVASATGIDAISHALESAVTTKGNDISRDISQRAWKILASSFMPMLSNPENIDLRGNMQAGAALAGAAIENSMLGAAHACANPLTARYGVTHGFAVALMLPHVIRYNSEIVDNQYAELCDIASITCSENDSAGDCLAQALTDMLKVAGIQTTLTAYGVVNDDLSMLAREAAAQWTGNFNPRPVDEDSILKLYNQAMRDIS